MQTVYDSKKDCCGCTACKSICPVQSINMIADEEGFLYPDINHEQCIGCGLCKRICAFQNENFTDDSCTLPEVYAAKHKDNEVRKKSSSGGAFTAISDHILIKNGVVYGAAYDESFRVVHKRAQTTKERDELRGSKYVQSDLNNVFIDIKEDLTNDRIVLFTGTGCQAAGLISYLKNANVDTKKLITVDLICHGVPSPNIFQDYICYLERKNRSKIKQYLFRSKVNGWGHTEEAVFENGRNDYTSKLSQAHKELFYSDLCLRPSCHNCKYAYFTRPADITIADYWGVEKYFPKFYDTLGVSAILINTNKGKEVFLESADCMEYIKSNINDCASRQNNLHSPTPMNPQRAEFWSDYLHHGFNYIIKKYTHYGFKKRMRRLIIYILKRIRGLI